MTIPLTNRQQELLDTVRGLRSAELGDIARAMGVTDARARYLLRILNKRGLVRCSRAGKGGRWFTPENAGHADQAHEDALERERVKERSRKAQWQRNSRERAFELWCAGATRRIVPAASCPPIRPPAPASVFHLAQCA